MSRSWAGAAEKLPKAPPTRGTLSPSRMSERLRPGAQGLACLTCNIDGLKSLTVLVSWQCGMLAFRSPFQHVPLNPALLTS